MTHSFYNKPYEISAYNAKFEALKISFAPVIFQTHTALLRLGILQALSDAGESGMTVPDIAVRTDVSEYGVKVLLHVALSTHVVWKKEDYYILDTIGIMLLSDEMIKVNMNFIQDVCYEGLFHLDTSIKNGTPEGLKVFGDWESIYPALFSLPDKAKESWLNFDHYYSDKLFKELLPVVFEQKVYKLLDVGGNTGKWAQQCLQYNNQVCVTVADLPQQIKVAEENIARAKLEKNFSTIAIDVLSKNSKLPTGYDVIWMSQFLDCFSEAEIITILRKTYNAMSGSTKLYILELFGDRQDFEPASFAINCTSIYFTAMANGNSKMYHFDDFIKLLPKAGLKVIQHTDMVGHGHTLLICKRLLP